MKPYRIRHASRPKSAAYTIQLTLLINMAAQELANIREQHRQIGSMLMPEAGKTLELYLTIAKNSLAEARKFFSNKRHLEAWQRIELVDKELSFSHQIIEKYHSTISINCH